jgi:hypothetical protein
MTKAKKRTLLDTTALAPAMAAKTKAPKTAEIPVVAAAEPVIEASDDGAPRTGPIELLPPKTGSPSPAEDLLIGASAISEFLYGTSKKRRTVYYLAEIGALPAFRWGGQLTARKSTLLDFLATRERKALANLAAE